MDKDEKPKENKQTSKEEIESPNSQPSAINTSEKEPSSDTPSNHTNNKKEKDHSNRRLFWVNIGMLLSFIIVNIFLINNSNQNIDLVEKSILATNEALRISDSTLSITEFNMITSNAPYMTVDINKEIFEVGKPIKFGVKVQNIGKTPALNFRSNVDFLLDSTNNIKREAKIPEWRNGKTIPPSGGVFSNPEQKVLTASLLKAVNKGLWYCSIIGLLEYDDVFGYEYRITFNYFYKPLTNQFIIADEGYEYHRKKK